MDGNNLLGPVVGNFCIDLAIRKAKEAGIGWVVARGLCYLINYVFFKVDFINGEMLVKDRREDEILKIF